MVTGVSDEDSTAELKLQQEARERAERAGAAGSSEDAEAAAHLRRAEKAAYLREKLAERERAEDPDPDR
jgi:hypothetical protein